MTEKCEKYLDRIAKSFDELVKVQKRELKILEDSHRLAVHNYELNVKAKAEAEELNKKIQAQVEAAEKEMAEWSQSNQKKST